MWTPGQAIPEIEAKLAALPPNTPDAVYLMIFMDIVSRLKSTKRTGWVDREVPDPESIADHMYRMSVLCFMSNNQKLDIAKAMQIALFHDMAEALVGDITPYDTSCDKTEKHRRELSAMEYLRDLVSKFNPRAGQQMYELWCEYEFQTSDEAKLVKDIDKIEMVYQCNEYLEKYPGKNIAEIFGATSLIKTDEVKTWAEPLTEQAAKLAKTNE